jgi:hypothetical protein
MSACSESSRAEGAGAGAGTAVVGLRSTEGADSFITEEEAIPGWSWIPSGGGALREVFSHAAPQTTVATAPAASAERFAAGVGIREKLD